MKKLATYLATVLIAGTMAVGVAPPASADDAEPCSPIVGVGCVPLPPVSNVCELSAQPLHDVIALLFADRAEMDRLLAASHAREVQLASKVERQAATIERLRDRLRDSRR